MIEDIFTNLAKDINNSVQKVLSSQEFSDLKSTVRSSFSQFDQGAGQQDPASPEEQARRREEYRRQQEERQRQRAQQQAAYRQQQEERQRQRAQQQEAYRRQQQARQQSQPSGQPWHYVSPQQRPQRPAAPASVRPAGTSLAPIRSGDVICKTLLGIAGMFFFGLSAVQSLIFTLTAMSLGGILKTSLLGSLFALSVVLLIAGINGIKQRGRFRSYRILLRGRDFCRISDLSSAAGVSEKRTLRDLERMAARRYLPEAYFDQQKTFVILNKSTYQQYLTTQENARRQQLEEEADPQKAALSQMKAEGSRYIWRIREINADLPEEEISNQLDRLAEICQKIFVYVEEHPEKLSGIHKFMSYYLPTTLKLLEAYRDLQQRGIETADAKATKAEIQNALSNITLAFENLFADLVKDDLMDLSADISVLETMLTQEGLIGDEDFSADPEKPAGPESPLHL